MLQFQYKAIDVPILVEDIDKVNLIDLIIEYQEKAKEKNLETPKYPTFKYIYKMKHVNLEIDIDLMKMFTNFPDKKEIYVWVGDGLKDSKVVAAARSLVKEKHPMHEFEVDRQLMVELEVVRQLLVEPTKKLTPRNGKTKEVEDEVVSKEDFDRHVKALGKQPALAKPEVLNYDPEETFPELE